MLKNLFSLTLLCAIPFLASAQDKEENEPLHRLNFGFNMGTNKVMDVESSKPGLTIGSDAYYYFTHHLGFSFKPTLSLFDCKLPDNPTWIETANLEIPLHGVLRFGQGTVMPLVETGLTYRFGLSGSGSFPAWDVSAGVELQNGMLRIKRDIHTFSMVPEIRYSYSQPFKAVYFSLHFLGPR
jgi:hypothetical protein